MTHRPRTHLRAPGRGFTLVETLVAITVLVIAIVGPLYAIHRSVIASYTARDQLIATALAQEGVEYIRNERDGNYLGGAPDWMSGLAACEGTTGCTVDPSQNVIQACPTSANGGCPALRMNPASKLYMQSTNSGYPQTKFTRKVEVRDVGSAGTEVDVIVTVSWVTLGIPYTVVVHEHLYNWL